MNKTLIIAEAGVNHNGSLELAYQLVDAAKAAGADIVKFQTFVTDNLVTKSAKQAEYQSQNIGEETSQWQMLKHLELSFEQHKAIKGYCQRQKIEYLSTAFDLESLAFLSNDLQLRTLKIPSGELTNAPYLLAHAQTGAKLIVSTGMSSLDEIEDALGVIAYGYLHDEMPMSLTYDDFSNAFNSAKGQDILREKVVLLHCTSEYPAPLSDIHLRAMDLMKQTFSLPVGYSDHSEGLLIPTAAVAKGAVVIEKHFTLDKSMPGPDHKASIDPQELAELVRNVRNVEKALGREIKKASLCEEKNKLVVRKSLVAAEDIAVGESFTSVNVEMKRPGMGISPFHYWQLLDKVASKSFSAGELISEDQLV